MAPQPVDTIYLPYLNGERSPFVDPLARAAFIGIGATSDAPALTRAVLTGVAYGYRHALEALVAHTSESLTVTGGGTASRAWTQIFADVLGIPVQVAADAQHVGVRGVVFAAQGSAAAVPIAETVQPDATHREFYDRQFEVFRAAYLALRPVFAQMAAE
ncbi:MAG: FGGY-family carbohydrate kinase [Chloroflexota bacterium]